MILHVSAKYVSGPRRWVERLTLGGAASFSLLVALSSTGCHKASSPVSNVSAAESNAVAVAQTHEPIYSPTPAAMAPAATPNGEPDLAELNRSLLRWVMANRRKPASFEDFAATANVTIPPPPAGKKYAINKSTMHIVLVNQ